MSLREKIARELDALSDEQLERVAHYLTLVNARSQDVRWQNLDEVQLGALYAEFADEDRELAEQGIDDYADMLAKEDAK